MQVDEQSKVTIGHVLKAASTVMGVSQEEIRGRSRDPRANDARHVAVSVARRLTRKSYARIGNEFGNRDYTTIRWAVTNAAAMAAERPEIARALAGVEACARELAGVPEETVTPEQAQAMITEATADTKAALADRAEAERVERRKAEMLRLRARGWSVNGLSRRYGIEVEQVYSEIGEKPLFGAVA